MRSVLERLSQSRGSGGSRDVEGCIGGQDRREGLDVSPLGAVDVGSTSFGKRVGDSNFQSENASVVNAV